MTTGRFHALSEDSLSLSKFLSPSNLFITFCTSWSQSARRIRRQPVIPVDAKASVRPIQRPQSFISCLKAR